MTFEQQFIEFNNSMKKIDRDPFQKLLFEIKLCTLPVESLREIAGTFEAFLQEDEYFTFDEIDLTDVKQDYIRFEKYGFGFSIWRNSINEDIHKFRLEVI